MKVDFCTTLCDFDGNPVQHQHGENRHDATLKSVCVEVLMARFPDEQLSPGTQIERYSLAKKIHHSNGDGLEVTTDQVVELKKLLAKGYSPAIVGAACELLDPAALE